MKYPVSFWCQFKLTPFFDILWQFYLIPIIPGFPLKIPQHISVKFSLFKIIIYYNYYCLHTAKKKDGISLNWCQKISIYFNYFAFAWFLTKTWKFSSLVKFSLPNMTSEGISDLISLPNLSLIICEVVVKVLVITNFYFIFFQIL